MRTCVVALAFLASGCLSTAELQRQPPLVNGTSFKSMAAIEECVALRLSWIANPQTIRGEKSIIMTYGQPTPTATVTITDRGTDRLIELRGASNNRAYMDLNACQ